MLNFGKLTLVIFDIQYPGLLHDSFPRQIPLQCNMPNLQKCQVFAPASSDCVNLPDLPVTAALHNSLAH